MDSGIFRQLFAENQDETILFDKKPHQPRRIELQKNIEKSKKLPITGQRCIPSRIQNDQIHFFASKPVENFTESEQIFMEGIYEPLPDTYEIPDQIPEWINLEKVKIGQKFAQKYYYGVNFAEMLSLMFLFSAPNGLNPLIYTEKSHTPQLAYKRYLSTALRVKSWYDTEFWKFGTEGYKNLKVVKSMHLNISKRMNNQNVTKTQLQDQCNLENKLEQKKLRCPLNSELKKDFELAACKSGGGCPFAILHEKSVYFNQLDMCTTQFGFFGLILVYKEKLGAAPATDEELEGFVQLWGYLGYLLGLKDKYNLCKGTLSEVKQRSINLVESCIKPTFLSGTKYWEHMSRCAIKGIDNIMKGVSFDSSLLYLCWLFDIKIPNATVRISNWDILSFKLAKFAMCKGYNIPGFIPLINFIVISKLKQAQIESKHH